METKRSLRREKQELQQRLASAERGMAESEQSNACLMSRLEEKDLTIASLREQKNNLESMLRLEANAGIFTRNSNTLANAFHYYDLGNNKLAKECLSLICDSTKEDRIRLYKYTDRRHEKEFFFLNKVLHYANLKGSALLIRYKNKGEADIPVKVHDQVRELKANQCQPYLPNIPETLLKIDEFLIVDEIKGPTLFDFFIELERKPDTEAKKMLLRALLRKQLRDNALIGTREYNIDHNIIITPDHEQKLLECFEEAKAIRSAAERDAIVLLARPLNMATMYQYRDGAAWNYTIEEEESKLFLSDEFMSQKRPDRAKIDKSVQSAVWAIDFGTLRRLTFQQDDTIHALEWFHPTMTRQERLALERYSMRMRHLCGDDVSRWSLSRELAGFYRHIRTDLFFKKNSDNYPDPGDVIKQHHLRAAFSALYNMAFGSEPSPEELSLSGIDLRRIVELAIHPKCQEKARYTANFMAASVMQTDR